MMQDTAESPFTEFAEVGKSFGKALKATDVAVLQRTAGQYSYIFGHLRKPESSVFSWRQRGREGKGGDGWNGLI